MIHLHAICTKHFNYFYTILTYFTLKSHICYIISQCTYFLVEHLPEDARKSSKRVGLLYDCTLLYLPLLDLLE
jgi:hypothetical protein